MKGAICLAAYWILFVIVPGGIILWFVPLPWRIASAIPIGLLLLLIGEHGFRKWKRIWKVD